MRLFYLRHGDPTYIPDALTPLGRRQAEALAKRLAVYGVDKIYSSTSQRAYQTAQPTAELTKKEIVQIDEFNEKYAWERFAIPDREGKRRWLEANSDYRQLLVSREIYELGDRWYEHPRFAPFGFGESMTHYQECIDAFLLSLGYEHDRESRTYKALQKNDQRVAVFAHGGFGGIFLSHILDIPYPMFVAHQALAHTAMTVIDFAPEGEGIIPCMHQFGNDSHLYREGLPLYHG